MYLSVRLVTLRVVSEEVSVSIVGCLDRVKGTSDSGAESSSRCVVGVEATIDVLKIANRRLGAIWALGVLCECKPFHFYLCRYLLRALM